MASSSVGQTSLSMYIEPTFTVLAERGNLHSGGKGVGFLIEQVTAYIKLARSYHG